jgi:hypothetical protein
MPLGLTVSLLVLGGVVLAGIAGYLIDHSEESTEHFDSAPVDSKLPDSKGNQRP